eukprot:755993-Hanusia_phi.AAC.3
MLPCGELDGSAEVVEAQGNTMEERLLAPAVERVHKDHLPSSHPGAARAACFTSLGWQWGGISGVVIQLTSSSWLDGTGAVHRDLKQPAAQELEGRLLLDVSVHHQHQVDVALIGPEGNFDLPVDLQLLVQVFPWNPLHQRMQRKFENVLDDHLVVPQTCVKPPVPAALPHPRLSPPAPPLQEVLVIDPSNI